MKKLKMMRRLPLPVSVSEEKVGKNTMANKKSGRVACNIQSPADEKCPNTSAMSHNPGYPGETTRRNSSSCGIYYTLHGPDRPGIKHEKWDKKERIRNEGLRQKINTSARDRNPGILRPSAGASKFACLRVTAFLVNSKTMP